MVRSKAALRLFVSSLLCVLSAGAQATAAEKTQLTCTSDDGLTFVFVLNGERTAADFVSISPPVRCALVSDETEYIIKCPKTEQRHETWVKINRYTGEMQFEFGSPPFFSFKLDNLFHQGSCTSGSERKLF